MNKQPAIYSTTWSNKLLTSEAQSLDDMMKDLRDAANYLEHMKRAGIEGNFDGAGDDCIYLTTTDPELAKEFGMEENEMFEDQ